jgi:hypothetical protein
MDTAENYAVPVHGNLGGSFVRSNDFNEKFHLRWGKIIFDVSFGAQLNVKVILRVYRDHNICETYIVDTDPYDIQWNHHKRRTRDFYIHPSNRAASGPSTVSSSPSSCTATSTRCPRSTSTSSWIGQQLRDEHPQYRRITSEWATHNSYRTHECNAWQLQSDVDWYNHHFDSLRLIPKFTKGQQYHPYHPKRFIHDHIDKVIRCKQAHPDRFLHDQGERGLHRRPRLHATPGACQSAGSLGAVHRRLAEDDAHQ